MCTSLESKTNVLRADRHTCCLYPFWASKAGYKQSHKPFLQSGGSCAPPQFPHSASSLSQQHNMSEDGLAMKYSKEYQYDGYDLCTTSPILHHFTSPCCEGLWERAPPLASAFARAAYVLPGLDAKVAGSRPQIACRVGRSSTTTTQAELSANTHTQTSPRSCLQSTP